MTDADPLAEPCPECGRPIEDHTVREWIAHTQARSYDVPFIALTHETSGPVENPLIVDTIDVRSMIADVPGMGRMGIVELHWQQGNPIGPPKSIARVHFLGPPQHLRRAGKLVNAAMHRSANIAEGGR